MADERERPANLGLQPTADDGKAVSQFRSRIQPVNRSASTPNKAVEPAPRGPLREEATRRGSSPSRYAERWPLRSAHRSCLAPQ